MHAAATLAAADAIAPCEGAARDAMMKALLPPRGWWATSGGAATSGSTFPTPSEKMEAARALFSRRDACATVARARCVALLSTLRVPMLVVPAARRPGARRRRRSGGGGGGGGGARRRRRSHRAPRRRRLGARARGAPPPPSSPLRGVRASAPPTKVRRRRALRLLRRLAVALGRARTRRPIAPARKASRRSRGRVRTRGVALRGGSRASRSRRRDALPPRRRRSKRPRSILPAAADDDDGGGSGGGLADDRDDADDADVEKRPSMTDGARRNASARESANPRIRANPMESSRSDAAAVKLELVALLRASWRLHVAATTREDSIVTRGFAETIDSREAEDDDSHTDASHPAAWRADQAGLIPLLAASYGATLSPCDRHLAALLTSLDAAAGGGRLAGLGYLWGESASYFVRTRAAIRRASGSTSALEEDAEERRAAAAESIAARSRGRAAGRPSVRGDGGEISARARRPRASPRFGATSPRTTGRSRRPTTGRGPPAAGTIRRPSLRAQRPLRRRRRAEGLRGVGCVVAGVRGAGVRRGIHQGGGVRVPAFALGRVGVERVVSRKVAGGVSSRRDSKRRPAGRAPRATSDRDGGIRGRGCRGVSPPRERRVRSLATRGASSRGARRRRAPGEFLARSTAGAAAGKGSDDANAALASRGEARRFACGFSGFYSPASAADRRTRDCSVRRLRLRCSCRIDPRR